MLKILKAWFSLPQAPALALPDAAEGDAAKLRQENSLLKAELRRYANLINMSPHLVWLRDEQQHITFCNLAFSEVIEEILDTGAKLAEVELFPGHRQMAEQVWESGVEAVDRRHVVVEGQRRLYTIREVPLKKEGMILGYGTHITELEDAHNEIQRHVSALRDLLDSSTSAMAIYGRDQKLKFFNYAFTALWKLEDAWLNNEPTYGEIIEVLREKRKLPEQANFKAFKQQQLKLFTTLIGPEEEFYYLPDGKTLRAIAIPHAMGGILFAYEDVTDRLALERSYNTLIAVQRETLDNLQEGIAVFTENGRLSLSNPVFQKLWNMSSEFLDSEPSMRSVLEQCQEFFVADDWLLQFDKLMARFQQRQFSTLRFERRDGTVVNCFVIPLPDGATMLSFTDITDSTLVERSLRERAEALEAADRLKTEFLANMSYELRSPLTSISGFAEMLSHEYAGPLSTAQKEYVGGIYDSAQHLAGLISDIIDLATIEAGYLKLDVVEFDVRAALENSIALLKERMKLQHVNLVLEVATGLTTMCADEVRVKQILINLVTHAVKITKAKGTIRADVTRNGEGAICLQVGGEGAVMDAARSAQLFDPFFRIGSRNEAALGLTLVKRFVELHGGRVEVNNAEGQGTAIMCVFPQ